jgi:hypothetical protein
MAATAMRYSTCNTCNTFLSRTRKALHGKNVPDLRDPKEFRNRVAGVAGVTAG